ncbi:MAG: alkaline phosphatase PafA [Syntrophothermus sp.]
MQAQETGRPKLVVGIMVDQMRYDYLYKYQSFYGKGGFKRLINEGSNFTYAHFNYVPTSTGPGHASVYTGTTPYYHGIINNNWYDRTSKKSIYCCGDTSYKTVGSTSQEGEMSPLNLLSTTITDQVKLSSNGRSKVISIALKDRGAILPGGRWANAAYWYDNKTGCFISSTYYMDKLPDWVEKFNAMKLADSFLSKGWHLLRNERDYAMSAPDQSAAEHDAFSEGKTSFPHFFDKMKNKYDGVEITPFGNEMVARLAMTALTSEKLGKGKETDFLAVSFSSTDFISHAFGSDSYENQDTYMRLDGQIEELLNTLDREVGKGNYLLFLSADHAAINTPALLKQHRLPAGELNQKRAADSLKAFVKRKYGNEKIIESISGNQIFLSRELTAESGLNIHEIMVSVKDFIRDNFTAVNWIFTRDELDRQIAGREERNFILNGYNPSRSGDIALNLQPGFLPNFLNEGTTHGSPYTYDTHVPMIYFGWHVPKQTVNTPVYIVDIAATIANLLNITETSAAMGIPLIKQQ